VGGQGKAHIPHAICASALLYSPYLLLVCVECSRGGLSAGSASLSPSSSELGTLSRDFGRRAAVLPTRGVCDACGSPAIWGLGIPRLFSRLCGHIHGC
jgi:hypothetical protein